MDSNKRVFHIWPIGSWLQNSSDLGLEDNGDLFQWLKEYHVASQVEGSSIWLERAFPFPGRYKEIPMFPFA